MLCAGIFCASEGATDILRIATFDTELSRKGPGLMLRDILRDDPQAKAVAQVIAHTAPDVILLQGVDYDHDWHGLRALREAISKAGVHYPYMFSARPNTGMRTGLDMDGDGRRDGPRDSQGYGVFSGQDGMAILSRFPIDQAGVLNFSDMLWRDLPQARLPIWKGAPFPSQEAQAIQRLSSTAHWVVPILIGSKPPLHLMAFHATPPVFDGPEDRNGLRNADEIRFWLRYLDGELDAPPKAPFVILGIANTDPIRGKGDRTAIRQLLRHPMVQDPLPQGYLQHAPFATADWPDLTPSQLRVDYVLPSRNLVIEDSGVFWPSSDAIDHNLLEYQGTAASHHRLVWVDISY